MFLKNNFRLAYAGAFESDKLTRAKRQNSSVMFNSTDSDDFNSFSSTPASNAPKAQKAPQKKSGAFSPKTIIIAAVSVIAVILLIVLISSMLSSGADGIKYEDNAFVCYQASDDSYHVAMNGKSVDQNFDGVVTLQAAGDNSFAYVVEETEDGTNVYILENQKLTLVLENVDECLGFAEFEPGVIFSVDERIRYYYDDGETPIEKNVAADNFVISPDGSKVVYTVPDEDNPVNVDVYMYSDGNTTPEALTSGILPVAVSNNGKYVLGYVTDTTTLNQNLCVVTEDDKFRIEGTAGSYTDISYVNSDGTEYVFTTFSGSDSIRTYVFNCNELKKDNRSAYSLGTGVSYPQVVDSSIARLETVKECYFQNESKGSTFYVDKDYSTYSIGKFIGQFDPELENFYYIGGSKDSLYKMEVKNGKTKDAEAIASDVKDFIVTSKGNIYYIDGYGELNFYKVSKEKSSRIMADVSDFTFYEYANDLYFEKDDSISVDSAYQTNEGSDYEAAKFDDRKVVLAPKFTNSYSKKTYAYFWDESKSAYALFYTSNGKSFKYVAECNVINGNYFEGVGDAIEDVVDSLT